MIRVDNIILGDNTKCTIEFEAGDFPDHVWVQLPSGTKNGIINNVDYDTYNIIFWKLVKNLAAGNKNTYKMSKEEGYQTVLGMIRSMKLKKIKDRKELQIKK